MTGRLLCAAAITALVAASGLATTSSAQSTTVWPGETWSRTTPAAAGMDSAPLLRARAYALRGGGAGMIVRGGRVVLSWGDLKARYDVKSTTKSIGVTALGLARRDGRLELEDGVSRLYPPLGVTPDTNVRTGWLADVTARRLATHTAGFGKGGGYEPLLFRPGTGWSYSDGGANWLAEVLTTLYHRDLSELLFERVFTPLGIGHDDLVWRDNLYRPRLLDGVARREFGAGISADVDALARIGLLYLRKGKWGEATILGAPFVRDVGRPQAGIVGVPVHDTTLAPATSPRHYGLLWWNNGDETLEGVPLDAFWSWGLNESLIVVVPSLDLVVVRAGERGWQRGWRPDYAVLAPFLRPIAESVRGRAVADGGPVLAPPYPPSPVIRTIVWAPKTSIVRMAEGSDNWPTTWGDDGNLYTAYGDGWGFEPRIPDKLSLGLARIAGTPDGGASTLRAMNLRAPTVETTGGGAAGKKASGLLMVSGVLYLWARNAGLSQLAWSRDRGATWTWADWTFAEGFAAPTFLNFGANYAGARDGYVYVYSHDAKTAYDAADRAILARVPKDRVAERGAYEFLARLDAGGAPVWTRDLAARGAVFAFPGHVYRSGISYDAGIRRYLWYQLVGTAQNDGRFEGAMGVYDAPEPWGPWTTAYFTSKWDVGPGDTGNFPTKWMSADGRTVHLVFSGDDYFSVRRGTIELVAPRR